MSSPYPLAEHQFTDDIDTLTAIEHAARTGFLSPADRATAMRNLERQTVARSAGA